MGMKGQIKQNLWDVCRTCRLFMSFHDLLSTWRAGRPEKVNFFLRKIFWFVLEVLRLVSYFSCWCCPCGCTIFSSRTQFSPSFRGPSANNRKNYKFIDIFPAMKLSVSLCMLYFNFFEIIMRHPPIDGLSTQILTSCYVSVGQNCISSCLYGWDIWNWSRLQLWDF